MALTESKKADRAKMVAGLAAIAAEFGIVAEVSPEGSDLYSPRRSEVVMDAARGLSCRFAFDGQTNQLNTFVNPWHVSGSPARLSDCFPDGDVNPFHFAKCTTVSYGYDDLCRHIRNVLTLTATGAIFDATREKRS